MKDVGLSFLLLLVLFLGVIAQGHVLSVLWLWFMVPFSLPVISSMQGAGIILIIAILRGNDNKPKVDIEKAIEDSIGRLIFVPFVVLGFGWLVKSFM